MKTAYALRISDWSADVCSSDLGLLLSSTRAEAFTGEGWLRRLGGDAAETWPDSSATPDGSLSCDALGCIYRKGGHVVALVKQVAALDEDCRVADVVVSLVPVRRASPSAGTAIHRFDLWPAGASALCRMPAEAGGLSVCEQGGR